MVHRGEEVKKKLSLKGVNLTELANRLGINRQTLYNQLHKADMKSVYIHKIGREIGYDFRKVIPNLEQDDFGTVVETQTTSSKTVVPSDPVNLTIKLDGTEESLERLFVKLKSLNDSIRSLNE